MMHRHGCTDIAHKHSAHTQQAHPLHACTLVARTLRDSRSAHTLHACTLQAHTLHKRTLHCCRHILCKHAARTLQACCTHATAHLAETESTPSHYSGDILPVKAIRIGDVLHGVHRHWIKQDPLLDWPTRLAVLHSELNGWRGKVEAVDERAKAGQELIVHAARRAARSCGVSAHAS